MPKKLLVCATAALFLVSLLSQKAFAQANELPTTEQFTQALTTCALGSKITVSADLLGSISSLYKGERTNGAGVFQTETKLIEQFPEADRAKVYELYVTCISKILYRGPGPNHIKYQSRKVSSTLPGLYQLQV